MPAGDTELKENFLPVPISSLLTSKTNDLTEDEEFLAILDLEDSDTDYDLETSETESSSESDDDITEFDS